MKRIRVLTRNYGVDVVMDSVGGEVFKKSWGLLAPMGRYVLYGVSAVTGKGAISRLKAAAVFSSHASGLSTEPDECEQRYLWIQPRIVN